MPGDPFKQVQAGQDLDVSAAAWNAMLGLLKGKVGQRAGPSRPRLPAGCLYVENATEDDLDRFAVIGVDDAIVDPAGSEDGFLQQPAVKGVYPRAEHYGRPVVLLSPLATGAVGVGMVSGVLACTLTVGAAADRFADADLGGDAPLKSGPAGSVRILWKEAGTGAGKRAVVSLGHEIQPFDAVVWSEAIQEPNVGTSRVFRWTHVLRQLKPKAGPKWSGWAPVDAVDLIYAYNRIEYGNSATPTDGVYGNGVYTLDLTATFALAAPPRDTVLQVWPVGAEDGDGNPVVEYWFSFENGVTGNCPE